MVTSEMRCDQEAASSSNLCEKHMKETKQGQQQQMQQQQQQQQE